MENFSFIDSSRNDRFYYLRGDDLFLLVSQILNFDLRYRDSLGLSSLVTFGVELEYEGVDKKVFDNYLNDFEGYKSLHDASLKSGGEIVTPILTDCKDTWDNLKEVCDYLRSLNPVLDKYASNHIHVGAHILDEVYKWRLFLKTYAYFEDILFRFGFGDKVNGREKIINYADPVSDDFFLYFDDIDDVRKVDDFSDLFQELYYRNHAVNLDNVRFYYIDDKVSKNTVEFRLCNGTCDKVIVQNNINVFTKLMEVYKSSLLDEDSLDYKLRNKKISSDRDFYLYGEVNLKKALEFVDIVFNNNLDKVYFLRQYLKNFESGYRETPCKSAKVFTRK